MKAHFISIGTYANRIIEHSRETILSKSVRYWQIDKDEDGYLNGNIINDCVKVCQNSSKVILLIALGGRTGSHAMQLILDEMGNHHITFSSVVILPHLMEGGINITRALQSVEALYIILCKWRIRDSEMNLVFSLLLIL